MSKQKSNNNNNNNNNDNINTENVKNKGEGYHVSELKKDFTNNAKNFSELLEKVEARIKVLDEKEKHWEVMEKRMQINADAAQNKIILDVGGKRFASSKATLLALKGSFFDAMLTSGNWKPDADGSYFIDRNPKLFPIILDYMRMGKINLKKYSYDITDDLQAELDFYQIKLPDDVMPGGSLSSKLLTEEQKGKLYEWLGKIPSAKLLYSAKQDGFEAATFHKKCDNKGPTLVLIQSNHGHLYGGYAASSWAKGQTNSPGSFVFVFSVYSGPIKFENRSNNHLGYNAGYGPMFGSDITICNNSNTTYGSVAQTSNYTNSDGYGLSDYLDDGYNRVLITEIEVFSVKI